VEKRFTANKGDVIFENSKIDSVRHMTITAKDGCVRAAGAQLTDFTQNVTFQGAGPCIHDPSTTTVDLAGAIVFAKTHITVRARGNGQSSCNPAAGEVCLDATGASFTARSLVPKFNADNSPDYDPFVFDTAAECSAFGGFGPVMLSNPNLGQVIMTTPNNGNDPGDTISICDAMIMPVP
jgi:hypothetical protein